MSQSKLTEIGKAIVDLIETWDIVKNSSYVKKPIIRGKSGMQKKSKGM